MMLSFEANTPGTNALIDLLSTIMTGPRKAVDLYCGAGTLGIALSAHGLCTGHRGS